MWADLSLISDIIFGCYSAHEEQVPLWRFSLFLQISTVGYCSVIEIDTRNQWFTLPTSGGISSSGEMVLKKGAPGTPHVAHSALRQHPTAWQWCGWWSRLHSGDLCQVSAFPLLLPLFNPYGSLPFLHLLPPPPPHINVTSLTERASGSRADDHLAVFCWVLLPAFVTPSGFGALERPGVRTSFTRFSWRGRDLKGWDHSEAEWAWRWKCLVSSFGEGGRKIINHWCILHACLSEHWY